jgi:carboxyl-terminal processing protease
VAFAVALVFALGVGIWLGGHPAQLPSFLRDHFVAEPSGLTGEAAEVIKDNYYRPVGNTELENSSLQGMVRELRRRHHDRFSDYFSPESLASFNEQIEGHFSGIGLSVTPAKRGLRVATVFPRSPAAEAGIRAGDTIVSVDGESIAGLTSNEATARIKGPEGTEVTVGVLGPKNGKVRKLTLTRAQVTLPNVSSQVKKVAGRVVGYIRMLSFSEAAHVQLANAVEKVEKEGAEGIVLDLRGNPGGLLQEAVLGAGIFLPEDEVVVSTKSRTQGDSVHKTGGDPDLGAARRRRRHRGRHPLLRQGRLPGGEEPRQRRRLEADRRRILHPGRGQPRPQQGDPSRNPGQRRSSHGGRRGQAAGAGSPRRARRGLRT